MRELTALIALLFLFVGCRERVVIEYHNNNNPKVINYYSRLDSTNYLQKGFYRVCELKYVARFKNGKIHGVYKEYYSNGKIKAKREYTHGIANGADIFYYENGAIRHSLQVLNGELRDGEQIEWYDNGQVRSKYTLINGKAEGDMVFYHKNGMIETKGKYLNDSLIDGFYFYDTLGRLERIMRNEED